jgi:hypothetical protein
MNTIPSLPRSVATRSIATRSIATRLALICLGLIIASTEAHAKVYRCVVNGNTTYTDRPCAGSDSETVNMVAPQSSAGPAGLSPKVATLAKAPPLSVSAAADSKQEHTAPKSAASGWRLAGGYSDRVTEPSGSKAGESQKTLRRSSYGIECEGSGLRPSVYAINNRYSLTAPDRSQNNKLQGPFFDTLDAAATAACAPK